MKKIAIIHGPNLNLLGCREPEIYGHLTINEINKNLTEHGQKHNLSIFCFQSNSEGELVGYIQQALIYEFDGIIINPAAYTHTSIAILDALKAVKLPFIEVHLSDIDNREDFRKKSFIRDYSLTTFQGEGVNSYIKGIDKLNNHLN
jgi:3-dehydroquinate dehydratase-2